ncbi:MAG: hypothetical protein SH809_15940, partial [Rhodothermales bacterium]|nr:hypothetical protein [Rhodothermales bacterium]
MTPSFPFDQLPGSSRLWIYALDRPLTDAESATLSDRVDAFIRNWNSHGRPVNAGYEFRHNQFVLIAGVIPGGNISGCGIDASVHALAVCGERSISPDSPRKKISSPLAIPNPSGSPQTARA